MSEQCSTQYIIAVFDLDGTITNKRSVESAFIRHLLRMHRIGMRNLLRAALHYVRHILNNPVDATKRNKKYLAGIREEVVAGWFRDFLAAVGNDIFRERLLDIVRQHRSAGHLTVLLTGSPLAFVEKLPFHGLFDYVFGTGLETNESWYTGNITGTHYYGSAKTDLIIQFAIDHKIDLTISYCYADSSSDIPVLSLFGVPVAVHPDRTLLHHAKKHNWKIMDE